MLNVKPFSVYTALYDLQRDEIDSRSFSDYLGWLRETVELFPGITVFHGGELDQVQIANCTLIRKPLMELRTFTNKPRVEEILHDFKPISPEDITFKLPSYALLQFAKFEFAESLTESTDSVIWVDAGLSRFLKKIDYLQFARNIKSELDQGVDYIFEVDIKNNLKLSSMAIKDAEVGSCKRIVSGGSFLIRSASLPILQENIETLLKQWLDFGVWDNEQVMLRKILPTISGEIVLIPQISGNPACLPRSMSNKKCKIYKLFKKPIIDSLIRGTDLY